MRIIIAAFFFLFSLNTSAQRLYGTVYTENGDLLPYASVTVKGGSLGASANEKANFSFLLPAGKHTIVCQHIGYASQEKTIDIKEDKELVFVLRAQQLQMGEVIVKTGDEDPAYEIIRQAIKKRPEYDRRVTAFSVDLYTKDMMKLRSFPKRIMGRKLPASDREDMGLDSAGQGIIYLSESVAKVNVQEPGKFKMEVESSRVSGSGGFGFTFPAFISLYKNNVKIFTERINPRGFISPIADGALRYYKYKFLGTFWEDGKAVNSIRVIPRRAYEPLFSGTINITDNDWRIFSFDLMLTKTSQLELLDTLSITQQHVPVGHDTWRVKNQLLHFNFNQFGIDAAGNFLNVYSNYNIKPAFKKNFFDNIIIKYDTAVNKRTKAYWDSTRPVPLENEELQDYKVKDSIYEVRKDAGFTQLTADSLNRRQGKVKLTQVIFTGVQRTRYSTKQNVNWGLKGIVPNMEFNNAEGVVVNLDANINTYLKKWKTRFAFEPHVRYGFGNNHLNAWANLQFRTRDLEAAQKIKRYSWDFAGGKRVSEFNKESLLRPLFNSIGILLYGKNNIKTYENYFGSIVYSKNFESGIRFTINGLFEDRIPLYNTNKFTIFKKDSIHITPNYPVEQLSAQFEPHQASIVSASISFKPGQKFIQLPYRKIPVGSKYPTFTFSYAKGIKDLFGSDVDFDKWRISVKDNMNLKLAGQLDYHIGVGGFLNSNKVYIQDYKHFNGNRSIAASEYLNSFQLATFYEYSNTASFYSYVHGEYHLNGLLTNKIPLFKRLNWNLVMGSNAFYVNSSANYVEVFAGLENILKVLRIDFVAAYKNGTQGSTGIRIGAGGILGGSLSVNRKDNSMEINF